MKLPSKPSALIRLAVNDLSKVERSKGYKVDMGTWHEPGYNNDVCRVCFAGAVLAKTCKMSPARAGFPYNFGEKDLEKMYALNYFRQGFLHTAMRHFSNKMYLKWVNKDGQNWSIDVVDYSKRNSKKFKKQMRNMARRFAKIGL